MNNMKKGKLLGEMDFDVFRKMWNERASFSDYRKLFAFPENRNLHFKVSPRGVKVYLGGVIKDDPIDTTQVVDE